MRKEGRNEDGRRYVGSAQPLFDRPHKQIWRVSARFESATTSDRLSIADPRILNRPEPTRAGITKDKRSGEFGYESLPYPILWNGNHQIPRLFTLGYLGTTYVASRNAPTLNALDSIPLLRRGNCRKGRAKKYRQESRMGHFQKNANE